MPTPTKSPAQTVYRLTDIDVEEVSVVDRAANQRKFLVVKSEVKMAKTGPAVQSDGKGGLTIAKETPAGETQAQASTPPAPTGGPTSEPKLQLSPEAKSELVKRFAAARARLDELEKSVQAAEEVAGLVEIPEAIVAKVAELLMGIAEGDKVAKSASSPVLLAKGLPQFSSARVTQLQAARDALDAVLNAIAKPAAAPAENAESEETIDETVAKAVAKALAPFEEKIAKGFVGISAIVDRHGTAITKQAETISAIDRGRSVSQSAPADAAARRETTEKSDEDDGSWPLDLADPDKHRVEKAPKETRFTK